MRTSDVRGYGYDTEAFKQWPRLEQQLMKAWLWLISYERAAAIMTRPVSYFTVSARV
jgi:hypothetical protein